ncbi:MAG: hypothetical protein AB1439_07705 [candidate division FCPU426 bacterium]
MSWLSLAVAAGLVAGLTLLAWWLKALGKRTLPAWSRASALQQLSRSYPGKSLEEIAVILADRERRFSRMLPWLPWQALLGLAAVWLLWRFVLPPQSLFWRTVAQNFAVFFLMLLGMIPLMYILRGLQRATLKRVQELAGRR